MTNQEIELVPEPSILIESLRDIGYSFTSAIADILDNSITANANHIDVYALPGNDGFSLAVIDNGEGLSDAELLQAMRLGSRNPREERDNTDLGRFGLGLKTASFSQCRRLTVVSRHAGQTAAYTWDLDTVVAENAWTVQKREDLNQIPFLDQLGPQGTLVLWEKVDRLSDSDGANQSKQQERVISELQQHLSLVFHRFLAGSNGAPLVSIAVNATVLEALDPFNVANPATQRTSVELICPNVTMQAFTLPHRSKYTNEQDYERYGLRDGYLRNQGIYVYRANRLIIYGTWFGLAKKTALTQLCRVQINIGTDQDERWKIDVKKVSAQLPEPVRDRIKSLLTTIGAPSKRVYKRRGSKKTEPSAYPMWRRNETGDNTEYVIDGDHPLITVFREGLNDKAQQKQFDSLLAFVGAMLPTEALFYDISNNADHVSTRQMSDEEFAENVKIFFTELSHMRDQEYALNIMQSIEPYQSKWKETTDILGVTEQ